MCLLISCFACNEIEIDMFSPEPVQQGDLLSLNLRSGGTDLPSGSYGLYGISHNYGDLQPAWPTASTFYLTNIESFVSSGKLNFGTNTYRFPISDFLSLYLYYPRQTGSTPNQISLDLQLDKNGSGDTLSYKYPDYIGGFRDSISVVGGTPKYSNELELTMKHLMARVRFQTKNPGVDNIVIDSISLTGIRWKGTLNPQITDANSGAYTPAVGDTRVITLIRNFDIPGNATGNPSVSARPIQIRSMFNYDETEASIGDAVYHDDFKYQMLVPPLSDGLLTNAKLEVKYTRYGAKYTSIVEMKQMSILEWQPGKSYCYTIVFDAIKIDYIDVFIEPWKEDIYIGSIDLQE